jgi:SAM-dependent methyltransferase
MHDAARRFCEAVAGALKPPARVVEIGSRNVNGSVRYLFPGACYVGVDAMAGPGVDVVADGATFAAREPFDVVLCTETLEHAADPAAMCRNLVALCRPGGAILVTAATPDRPPHSGIDGERLRDGEPYRGVTPADLAGWLGDCAAVATDARTPGDVYCLAAR